MHEKLYPLWSELIIILFHLKLVDFAAKTSWCKFIEKTNFLFFRWKWYLLSLAILFCWEMPVPVFKIVIFLIIAIYIYITYIMKNMQQAAKTGYASTYYTCQKGHDGLEFRFRKRSGY